MQSHLCSCYMGCLGQEKISVYSYAWHSWGSWGVVSHLHFAINSRLVPQCFLKTAACRCSLMPYLVPLMGKLAFIGCVTTSVRPSVLASWPVQTQATLISCSTFSLPPKCSKGQGHSPIISEENHSSENHSSLQYSAQRGERHNKRITSKDTVTWVELCSSSYTLTRPPQMLCTYIQCNTHTKRLSDPLITAQDQEL